MDGEWQQNSAGEWEPQELSFIQSLHELESRTPHVWDYNSADDSDSHSQSQSDNNSPSIPSHPKHPLCIPPPKPRPPPQSKERPKPAREKTVAKTAVGVTTTKQQAKEGKPARRMAPVPAPPPLPPSTTLAPPKPNKQRPPPGSANSSSSSLEIISDSTRMGPIPPPPLLSPTKPTTTVITCKQKRGKPSRPAREHPPAPTTKSKKPRLSLEQAVVKAGKISKDGLTKEFPTISSYLSHLDSFEPTSAIGLEGVLAGVRIVMVNTHYSPQNSFGTGVRQRINIMINLGATVVKPEDFTPSPSAVNSSTDLGDWKEVAEEENWTHYIIPFEVEGASAPTMKKIMSCLGDGIEKQSQLGKYVKVVKFSWVSECVKIGGRVDDWGFLWNRGRAGGSGIGGGSNVLGGGSRTSAFGGGNRVVETESGVGFKNGKGKARVVDPLSDEEGDDDGFVDRPCSPFGPNDMPTPSPSPPPDRNDRTLNTSTNSDPIVDRTLTQPSVSTSALPPPPPRAQQSFEGLQDQINLLSKFKLLDGAEIDALIEADDENKGGDEGQDIIYSKRDDDNETDEEEGNTKGPQKLVRVKKLNKYVCEIASTGSEKEPGANDHLAKTLDLLATFCDKGSFRDRGYKMAAGALRNTKTPVTTFAQAKTIRGIGDSIASKIIEINKTGTHRRLAQRTPKDAVIELFCGIYGIGQNISEEYYNLGCRTLDDIGKCTMKPLTGSQRLGLKYYDDLKERIPRAEVTNIYQYALDAAKSIDPKLQVHCMGSYRRGAPDCGDIDLLVTRDDSDGKTHFGQTKQLVELLSEMTIIRHALTNPDDWDELDVKFNGLCAIPGGKMRRIDILGVPWDELPAALIYFTGNDCFNRSMRLKARHLGLRLNQRGLYQNVMRDRTAAKLTEGVKIPCATEQDIFRRLGVTWRPPEERLP